VLRVQSRSNEYVTLHTHNADYSSLSFVSLCPRHQSGGGAPQGGGRALSEDAARFHAYFIQATNKAIVDYTSPALCTPITPFHPTGDAAYLQNTAGGPNHGHRQHAQEFGKDRACGSGYILTDRQTDIQTDRHIHHNTVLRDRSRGRSNEEIHDNFTVYP